MYVNEIRITLSNTYLHTLNRMRDAKIPRNKIN